MDYPFFMGHKEDISFKDVSLYAFELVEKEDSATLFITALGPMVRKKQSYSWETTESSTIKKLAVLIL